MTRARSTETRSGLSIDGSGFNLCTPAFCCGRGSIGEPARLSPLRCVEYSTLSAANGLALVQRSLNLLHESEHTAFLLFRTPFKTLVRRGLVDS
jgi:hypothetical protein